MDFGRMAREIINQHGPITDKMAHDVENALRAAFAAGREEMLEECQCAIIDALHQRDTWQPSYLVWYTDAMRLALGAIRALPGKEG